MTTKAHEQFLRYPHVFLKCMHTAINLPPTLDVKQDLHYYSLQYPTANTIEGRPLYSIFETSPDGNSFRNASVNARFGLPIQHYINHSSRSSSSSLSGTDTASTGASGTAASVTGTSVPELARQYVVSSDVVPFTLPYDTNLEKLLKTLKNSQNNKC